MPEISLDDTLKSMFDHDDATWKPSDKIPLIIKEIETHKQELKTFLSSKSYNLTEVIKESEELWSDSKVLVDDLNTCKREIEEETMAEIVKSLDNYDSISKELESVIFASSIIGDVIQCGQYVRQFEESREVQTFTVSVEAVCNLVQYLDQPSDGFNTLDIASKTREFSQHILDNLIQELFTEWSRVINWSVSPSNKKTVVQINIKIDNSKVCTDMLKALSICKKLDEKIDDFAEFIFTSVLQPVLYNDCTLYSETGESITITIAHKQNSPSKPQYDSVISNYRQIFEFLSTKLNINNGISILSLLGTKLSTQFAELITKDCFIDTIPDNITDLQSYGQITSEIEDFQQFLVSINFFPDNSISVLDYLKDIDILFADKASRNLLEQARTIMLKDLSASMSIGVASVPEEETSTNEEYKEVLDIFDKTLPKSLFYFPRCMISKSAQELLDLLYVMMEQAAQCEAVVGSRFYVTSRLVFELYDAVVPYHHENYLQTIPQYVALFHNNCMYLAHNMLTFGDKWAALAEREGRAGVGGEGRGATWGGHADLAQRLRALAHTHLAKHMQQQRNQILDNIRSSDLNCMIVKEQLGDNAEAAVRQCLRQLHLLKNVWIGVLPANVFTRLMATLVNTFLEELVHRVCSVEDLSAQLAAQLADIYTLVVKKAPQLFQNTSDIQTSVKSWVKLQELIFVLGGSLKDIELHWRDGAGPLAQHFRVHEIRSLVKALFQNTQIRANLLSKIK